MNWLIAISSLLAGAWILGKVGKFFGGMLEEFLRALEE
jgi:hypothetical protein